MKTSRHHIMRATAAAVALLSFGLAAGHARASVPPSEPIPATDASTPPVDGALPEMVQSWTLTPGGSADGDQAGSRPNLAYQVDPGTVIEDTVIVYNLGNVPMRFRIYATDAFNNDDGEFDLLPGEDVPVDVGSWVTLAQQDMVLPPGKQAVVPITITVPVDATPGDHVGAIVASNVAVSDNGDGQVVNVDRRTGTRMYIQVGGPLIRELAVTDLQTTYDGTANPLSGTADVTFRVENRGNVRLGGTPIVQVSGPLGIAKRAVTLPPLTELLPGQDVTLTAKLDDVPALLLAFTTVRIEPVEDAEVGGVETAIGKDRTLALPVGVLLLLAALLLAWMARRAYRRHRAHDRVAVAPQPSAEARPELEPQHQ
ncbi:MAG: hypothetical protein FD127_2003 [Acidimicrobiaceae bacterium]|jgi:hypothetical protein|nr:MAG: hypothetical protein FD127_2003 [Acidimicrobiaceae bacterium]